MKGTLRKRTTTTSWTRELEYEETETEAPPGMLLPSTHLTEVEKGLIMNNEWLKDKIINAAQTLLCDQYQFSRVDTTLLSQRKSGFDSAGYDRLQIHYDEDRKHWFTSSLQSIKLKHVTPLLSKMVASKCMSYFVTNSKMRIIVACMHLPTQSSFWKRMVMLLPNMITAR